jgi:hypothetical protein
LKVEDAVVLALGQQRRSNFLKPSTAGTFSSKLVLIKLNLLNLFISEWLVLFFAADFVSPIESKYMEAFGIKLIPFAFIFKIYEVHGPIPTNFQCLFSDLTGDEAEDVMFKQVLTFTYPFSNDMVSYYFYNYRTYINLFFFCLKRLYVTGVACILLDKGSNAQCGRGCS